ncbi:MAG: hypothetical protein CMN30_26605 [Sandaracinus sp.]|nr:hypothetical protein [Sandaracinus sp.]
MTVRGPSRWAKAALALAIGGCGSTPQFNDWFDGSRLTGSETARGDATSDALVVRWSRQITDDGPYIAVENAHAGLDPQHDRVYMGSSDGQFLALDVHGEVHWRYDPESGVESAPAVDGRRGELFLASEDGVVHALGWQRGEVRWKKPTGGPVREAPLLADDALYIVREDDTVVAMSRDDGEILWTYEREHEVEFAIAGHAGLLLHEGKLFTGFTDGAVVCLDAASGAMEWERLTQLDAVETEGQSIRFYDVDTTPVILNGRLWVASVSAGLYALSLDGGSVEWRSGDYQNVTGMAVADDQLVLASATDGVTILEPAAGRVVWRKPIGRGAPADPVVSHRYILIGESRGGLVAIDRRTGQEAARIEHGQGFSAPPAIAGNLGWAMTNGGKLIAFRL